MHCHALFDQVVAASLRRTAAESSKPDEIVIDLVTNKTTSPGVSYAWKNMTAYVEGNHFNRLKNKPRRNCILDNGKRFYTKSKSLFFPWRCCQKSSRNFLFTSNYYTTGLLLHVCI